MEACCRDVQGPVSFSRDRRQAAWRSASCSLERLGMGLLFAQKQKATHTHTHPLQKIIHNSPPTTPDNPRQEHQQQPANSKQKWELSSTLRKFRRRSRVTFSVSFSVSAVGNSVHSMSSTVLPVLLALTRLAASGTRPSKAT